MKVLVTGGKGVVGSSLVKQLEGRGHEVWVCDLKHSHESRYYRCDVGKYRQLLEIFRKQHFDYVYHLAAEYGRWNGEAFYEDLWISNAVGTKNMLRLQQKYGFRMIFTSSSEVYGNYDGRMFENIMDVREIKQLNDYAISKWVNELQILNSQAMFGSETVRLRLFNTYGPGEFYTPYRSAISIFAYHAIKNLPYTVYLNHQRSSVYIDDCCAALANVMDNFKAGEIYNIAGTELHTMKDISDLILDYLKKNDRQIIYEQEEKFTTAIKLPDTTKAVCDLGFNPIISLQEGIPRTIEWMRKYYDINYGS
ncbi:MAG: NAD(P)-dependent oxidoreductase [Syntrophomonadaceae bacterium]|nr:NAD(P)-dependent oxidoreductase [Syntrophomonadaceae bacterium]MDD3023372.1 NAD(P)-dependent oxidoreductase [Syntrophomonadaceae bacterium]